MIWRPCLNKRKKEKGREGCYPLSHRDTYKIHFCLYFFFHSQHSSELFLISFRDRLLRFYIYITVGIIGDLMVVVCICFGKQILFGKLMCLSVYIRVAWNP